MESKNELRRELLLESLRLRTGIKGRVSNNGRYVYLSGGRLKCSAFIETKDIYQYVKEAKSGKINATPSFRWNR